MEAASTFKMRKNIALGVAASVAGIYGYVMWKRQVAIFEEAKSRAKDSIKTLALKIVSGTAIILSVYIYVDRKLQASITK